ncbi:MAG: NADPH-dependent glutamate synthase [Candidatus Omnitrophica bacterium]|nr:NADPH-dependent glutamate synthase [Candidatus Omnitrophota bacterium]
MAENKARHPMPSQDPRERAKNFQEVALGYDQNTAVAEAARCLSCKNAPCRAGCPVGIDIPGFIAAIKDNDFVRANAILKDTNNLPAVCGRVCPQEDQCEKVCVLGRKGESVAIGRLERFASDWVMRQGADSAVAPVQRNGHAVAVIGSGPAGLTCAADLAKMGYAVTIFEGLHAAGGVLRYGIPAFRLPKDIVDREIAAIRALGVDLALNVLVGRTKTFADLRQEGFEAFFIAGGAGLPNFLGIAGEQLNGVYSANEFLTRVNLMKASEYPAYKTPVTVGRRVCVVGAGNVAMDSARCALRLGAGEVTIVYRRSEEEMPARKEEIEHAREEGIAFHLLTTPLNIIGDSQGWVQGLRCQKNTLGEPDASGRRRPVPIPQSEFELLCETIIVAIGQSPNPLLTATLPDLKLTRHGTIVVDDTLMSSMPGVFAGGDITTGAATVIEAMGAGKKAAQRIHAWLNSA